MIAPSSMASYALMEVISVPGCRKSDSLNRCRVNFSVNHSSNELFGSWIIRVQLIAFEVVLTQLAAVWLGKVADCGRVQFDGVRCNTNVTRKLIGWTIGIGLLPLRVTVVPARLRVPASVGSSSGSIAMATFSLPVLFAFRLASASSFQSTLCGMPPLVVSATTTSWTRMRTPLSEWVCQRELSPRPSVNHSVLLATSCFAHS